MKFKLCGDLDCPDWVLAEISTLSKMTSVKLKMLSMQVMKNLLGNDLDYEKVNKLVADTKFDVGDLKASIAALSFIFSSACKYDTDENVVASELQQLGLPKEHTTVLSKVYADNFRDLRESLKKKSLRLSRLEDVQWRVDYVISSSYLKEVNEPLIHLLLKRRDSDSSTVNTQTITMSEEQCRILLHELKEAYKIMENLS